MMVLRSPQAKLVKDHATLWVCQIIRGVGPGLEWQDPERLAGRCNHELTLAWAAWGLWVPGPSGKSSPHGFAKAPRTAASAAKDEHELPDLWRQNNEKGKALCYGHSALPLQLFTTTMSTLFGFFGPAPLASTGATGACKKCCRVFSEQAHGRARKYEHTPTQRHTKKRPRPAGLPWTWEPAPEPA